MSFGAKASTNLSIDLSPDFMRTVVGQELFLFNIPQQILPILEDISIEISKLRSSSFDSASHKELDVNHGQACIVYTKS